MSFAVTILNLNFFFRATKTGSYIGSVTLIRDPTRSDPTKIVDPVTRDPVPTLLLGRRGLIHQPRRVHCWRQEGYAAKNRCRVSENYRCTRRPSTERCQRRTFNVSAIYRTITHISSLKACCIQLKKNTYV